MAVYTEVSTEQARHFLSSLGLSTLQDLRPISSGIENTNYFVTTPEGEWVLTVFERLDFEQLPFYLQLMRHLARHGLPVPEPRANAAGDLVHQLCGKPAALVNRLEGESLDAPDLHHVAQLGGVLARLHLAVADFPLQQPNLRGLDWRESAAPTVRPYLDADIGALLDAEMAFQREVAASAAYRQLPRGAVHADLFRDNALFAGLPGRERLSGVFDFYFAGVDTFMFDLAVVLNDWCVNLDNGVLDEARAQALVSAYLAERVVDGAELRLLPAMRRAAALRFWLSRLADWHRRCTSSACCRTASASPGTRRWADDTDKDLMGLKLQDVPANQGWRWVRQGLRETWRHPMGYASLFVVFLPLAELLGQIPIAGPLLWMMGVPLISLAYMMATLRSLREHPPRLGVYLVPWRLPVARRRDLFVLCASYAVVTAVSLALCDLIDGGHLADAMGKLQQAQLAGDTATMETLASDGTLLWGSLVRAGVFGLISLPYWHAPALVVWGQQGVAQSLFSSLLAVWRARGAFLLYGAGWFGVSSLVALCVSLLAAVLGGGLLGAMLVVPAMLLLTSAFYVSLYFTFQDSFGLPDRTDGDR